VTVAALELAQASYSYPRQEAPAVDRVDLVVEPGERVALVGPSGCGKSTVLLLAAGILVPSAGLVAVGGVTVSGLDAAKRSRHRRESMGVVFQFGELVAELTLLDNVALAGELSGIRRRQARAVARESLDRLGIGELANRYPGQVSGGQAQRCAVARATVHRPALLLADEPTGAVDRANGTVILDELDRSVLEVGTAMLIATHDPDVVSRCDRQLVLRDGRISP
jgi:putative ABC transport system ATP-binding protein